MSGKFKFTLIFFVFAPIIFFSNSAMAEWEKIHTNTSVNAINYIDSATIRIDGGKVKFWLQTELKPPISLNGVSVMSIKAQNQIDCKEELSRTLFSSFFSESKAGGVSVYSNENPTNWIPIPPDDLMRSLFEVFCRK